MHARFDETRLSLFGACAAPCKSVVGTMLLLLSIVCLADALIVPRLFGGVAAIVVGCDRLLCAVRSMRGRVAAAWLAVACGWIALATCMLHSASVNAVSLRSLLVLIIAASALCRYWIGRDKPGSGRERGARWVVAVAILIQVATVFAATVPPLPGMAAAIAIELALTGILGLLQAAAEFPRHRLLRDSATAEVNLRHTVAPGAAAA